MRAYVRAKQERGRGGTTTVWGRGLKTMTVKGLQIHYTYRELGLKPEQKRGSKMKLIEFMELSSRTRQHLEGTEDSLGYSVRTP